MSRAFSESISQPSWDRPSALLAAHLEMEWRSRQTRRAVDWRSAEHPSCTHERLGCHVLWVGMLAAFDNVAGDRANNSYLYLVDCIMVFLQLVNILHVGLASWTLTHQMLKFRAASGFLMAQTYLSTVLLFSGFYLIIYRLDPSSWELSVSDPITKGGAFTQHVRMFYLSVSSATLCGAANIQPVSWYATIFLCVQSLVNFVYFASILAQTIGHCGSSETLLERRERLQSISRRLSGRAAAVRSPASHRATVS
ncbi:uncharacterized protein ISCGN_009315 [Ixodes scapularis]